ARWPWQRSLRLRILLSYGAVVLLVLALLTVLVGSAVYQAMIDEAKGSLELETLLAANALEDPLSGYDAEFDAYQQWETEHEDDDEAKADDSDDKSKRESTSNSTPTPSQPRATAVPGPIAGRLEQVAANYAADTGARVTILDPRGNVIADSIDLFGSLPNQLNQPEVQAALSGLVLHDVRVAPASGETALFVAAPIQQGDRILGLVQMTRPMQQITEGFRGFLLQLGGITLLALALATLLGIAISRRLVRPVQQLEQASLRVAGGDLSQQVPVETADELGALGNAFNSMVREVREMMAQQRLFVANASHELRTPLTNIKLRSEALLGGASEDPAVAGRYLAEIDREADRLGRLASALLDLSRLEEGRAFQTAVEPVDLLPLLRAVADATALRASQAGLTLHVDLPPALPSLAVWPEQVEAVLVNLLDNAIKFTPAGGQVSLSAAAHDRRCLIQVADSGPGIPAEDLPHVFERFYRVDKARSRSDVEPGSSGAGLGLAIVKALLEQNGGQITVESQPGRGTLFTVELPFSE
ncbi:MAG TPA: ATP-binding protein, partial [Anaerolineae bacterium]|nr:ATP-binding protein [Anaerolineae bacterium]